MTAPAVPGTRHVVIMSATEAANRFGALMRYVAAGCAVRVDDLRLKQTVCWIGGTAPEGVDTSDLPPPGTADYLPGVAS